MSIFDKIFSNNSEDEKNGFPWHNLENPDDLERAKARSFEKQIAIFKHSTRCYVSNMMLSKFEKEISDSGDETEFYFLDLLKHRSLSHQIAEDFDVAHQSPQLLVIKDSTVVKHASHTSISAQLLT